MNLKIGDSVIHPDLHGTRRITEVISKTAVIVEGIPGATAASVLLPAPKPAKSNEAKSKSTDPNTGTANGS